MAPWARLLAVLTNIINQKYPLQHSRNLYYHLQHIIHHIQLLRHEQLYHINLSIKTVLQFKKTPDISNTDGIHSCVTPRKQNISVQVTSTPPCLIIFTSIKKNVRTLPTYRWHQLMYTKYYFILQKYDKNNNEEYLILM